MRVGLAAGGWLSDASDSVLLALFLWDALPWQKREDGLQFSEFLKLRKFQDVSETLQGGLLQPSAPTFLSQGRGTPRGVCAYLWPIRTGGV